jgi:hypothetical protein
MDCGKVEVYCLNDTVGDAGQRIQKVGSRVLVGQFDRYGTSSERCEDACVGEGQEHHLDKKELSIFGDMAASVVIRFAEKKGGEPTEGAQFSKWANGSSKSHAKTAQRNEIFLAHWVYRQCRSGEMQSGPWPQKRRSTFVCLLSRADDRLILMCGRRPNL